MTQAKRRFAVSAWVWFADHSSQGYNALEKASSLGFDGIEIPTFNGHLNSTRLNEVMNSLSSSRRRLVPIVIGGGSTQTDLASDNSTIRENGIEYVKRCIERCSEIGGSLVCGPLYTVVGEMKYITEIERVKLFQRVTGSFKQIAKFARDCGVVIALEPLCRYDTYLINTSQQARQVVDAISEENVGILLDTFHMNIEEKSMSRAIQTAGEKLFHFHACENDRGAPGSGLIRWDEVALNLEQLNYERWVAIESFTPFDVGFASSMHVWRKFADNQDDIAIKGLAFLKSKLSN